MMEGTEGVVLNRTTRETLATTSMTPPLGGRPVSLMLDTEQGRQNISHKTTIVTEDELRKMIELGYGKTAIARRYKVPESTFRNFLNRNNLNRLFIEESSDKVCGN